MIYSKNGSKTGIQTVLKRKSYLFAVTDSCNTSFYQQSQKAYIPLHLPLFDGHLKYLLNFSTRVTTLEVVPTNSPSGTSILQRNEKQKLKTGDNYISRERT